jgi:hypothetical protein
MKSGWQRILITDEADERAIHPLSKFVANLFVPKGFKQLNQDNVGK